MRISTETNDTVSKNEYDKVVKENEELRAELEALKKQISNMNEKSNDLSKQNLILKEKVKKLSSSKSELEDLQKQKDDLFAVIIHDIKNPASLIKSLVDLLRSYDLTANEQQDVMNDIVETTSKIVTLSQEVTKILSIEANISHINKMEAPMGLLISDVVRRNSIAATNKNMEILTVIPDNLPEVTMDVQKIEEVLDNLLSNAIKFSHQGGKVKVSSYKKGHNLVVEVSDNGLGLSEDDLKKAFNRGMKLSASPTAGEHSSGFGLWIVKKMIDAHDGKVWVKSALGKGSTFAFSLPLMVNE